MKLYPLLATAVIVIIAGCISSTGNVVNMKPAEFSDLIKNNDVFLIDTHVPEQEHIGGTDAFIPYDELDKNIDRLPADKNTPIAVYCRSGTMSSKAAEELVSIGYTKIYNLAGGTDAWNNYINPGSVPAGGASLSKATVYKSGSCGCCAAYVYELQKEGFEVETINKADLAPVKSQYGVPYDKQSCHTAVFGDYFVEGHVPISAVKQLLQEKPEIDGIALPDMPVGSPGMPGIKREKFSIYSIENGEANGIFAVI